MALVITMDRLEKESDTILNELASFALEGASLNMDGVFLGIVMMAKKAVTAAENKEIVSDVSEVADLLFKEGEESKKAFDLVMQFSKALAELKETTPDWADKVCIISKDAKEATGFELLIK